jgi:hypothetical protein
MITFMGVSGINSFGVPTAIVIEAVKKSKAIPNTDFLCFKDQDRTGT